jgi:hypothetical protein
MGLAEVEDNLNFIFISAVERGQTEILKTESTSEQESFRENGRDVPFKHFVLVGNREDTPRERSEAHEHETHERASIDLSGSIHCVAFQIVKSSKYGGG